MMQHMNTAVIDPRMRDLQERAAEESMIAQRAQAAINYLGGVHGDERDEAVTKAAHGLLVWYFNPPPDKK
jgi:hypothetical protein